MKSRRFHASEIQVKNLDDRIDIETARYHATVVKKGYVSGVKAGSFVDKKTGARDLGFGLDIVDFLLEPADPKVPVVNGQYEFGPTNQTHGNIPKRYVEGPQICTQAKQLKPTVATHGDVIVVKQAYSWNVPYAPREKPGSVWEQSLILLPEERFFLASDRVTVANSSSAMTLRVDLPGHVKHEKGKGFDHIYLSYRDDAFIPSTEFVQDFPPDARFLYTRGIDPSPKRFIRAYQPDLGPAKGESPWLAGMTLNPEDVSQAWCHQRGYVCMIEEIGGRPVKSGDTFGAAYVIGWFDDLAAMNATYDRFKGFSGFEVDAKRGYRGVTAAELTAIRT